MPQRAMNPYVLTTVLRNARSSHRRLLFDAGWETPGPGTRRPYVLTTALGNARSRQSPLTLLDPRDDAVEHFVQVADDAEIGKCKDRRLGILVHRDDGL